MKLSRLLVSSLLLVIAAHASARDDVLSFSIQEALATPDAVNILGTNVKFYFGDAQPTEKVLRTVGEYKTNRKTNAATKSDIDACQRAFISTLISLRDSAKGAGANAVINIKSNYRNNTTSSNDTFQCGVGGIIAGVALVGDVVVLENQ
ncbi:MAG TPA: excinuclease ABC subunit A [Cellvibrio sp.]|nr:excinuclease ABC subunit A [Cellvibrio sp.]